MIILQKVKKKKLESTSLCLQNWDDIFTSMISTYTKCLYSCRRWKQKWYKNFISTWMKTVKIWLKLEFKTSNSCTSWYKLLLNFRWDNDIFLLCFKKRLLTFYNKTEKYLWRHTRICFKQSKLRRDLSGYMDAIRLARHS